MLKILEKMRKFLRVRYSKKFFSTQILSIKYIKVNKKSKKFETKLIVKIRKYITKKF